MKHRAKRSLVATWTVSSGLSVGLVAPVFAQEAAAPEPPANPALETVVITGSHVPTTRDAAAVSITRVDAEQIEKSGVKTDVLEILRKGVPSFQGRSNTGGSNANNTNQNTAGGAQVQLKNLDTLILVNGRRVAISAIAAIGGKSFVNVSQIPPSAIDRIEVLSDGASAIYGSDAIGGVVNIILKSDYDGREAGVRYGVASGDYTEHSAYFTLGTGQKDFSVTLSGSLSHTDPLFQNRRSFTSPKLATSSVVPGTIGGGSPAILAPGLNSPSQVNPTGTAATATSLNQLIANGTYLASTNAANAATNDISQFQTLLLKQDQQALSVNANYKLLDKRLVAFGDAEFAKNKSFTQYLPVTQVFTVPAGAPFNPLTGNFPSVNFAYWPAPKQTFNDQQSIRATAGLRGDLGEGWSWETALLHSKNTLKQRQANLLFQPNLAAAIAGGYDANGNAVAGGGYSRVYGGFSTSNAFVYQPALDPFARAGGVNPAALQNLYGSEVLDMTSVLNSIDASITGKLFDLPAGNMMFAAGVGHRKESLSADTSEGGHVRGPNAAQWIGGDLRDPFSKSRVVDAGFLELRVPLASEKSALPAIHALDLIGAVRQEHYSDAGNSLVPKIGFRWQPVDSSFTMRGSYSKSFTAPTLFAEYGPTNNRLVGSGVIQTVFGLPNAGLQGQDGNNPNLQPSKADSYSLNLTFRPESVPGLSLVLEYNSVKQRGYPGGIGFTNILDSVNRDGAASPFANNIAKGNFPGQPGATPFTSPGELRSYLAADPNNSLNVYAIDRFMNLGGVRVKSFNLSGAYDLPSSAWGDFSVGTTGTLFQSYQFQALPYQKFYEYAGTATNGGTGVQGTLPKYRFYTTLDWQRGHWAATLGNTFVSSVTDIGPGGIVYENSTTLKPKHVSSYTTFDLRVAYKGDKFEGIKGSGWTVAFGINNIANKMPPLAPQAFTDNNADVATYSPIGRLFYTTAQFNF